MENNNENEKSVAKMVGAFKPEKRLAEDAFQIKIKDFGKKLLHPIKQGLEDIMGFVGENNAVEQAKKGEFIARTLKGQGLVIFYRVDLTSDPIALDLSFVKNQFKLEPGVSQRIDLGTQGLAWGTRWYFICQDCGRRCNVLYLPAGYQAFGCLKCRNLTYESCRLNRRSTMGLVYYLNQRSRLADKREKIDRPFYRGKWTKRFERFVGMYSRLEKMSQTESFQNLLKLASVH